MPRARGAILFSFSIPFTSYFSIISFGLTDGERPCDVGELGFHRQVRKHDVLRVALRLEGEGRTCGTVTVRLESSISYTRVMVWEAGVLASTVPLMGAESGVTALKA